MPERIHLADARRLRDEAARVRKVAEVIRDCAECPELVAVPEGSVVSNRFGLHDVYGNVWKRVQDCWNGYCHGAPRDRSAWGQGSLKMEHSRCPGNSLPVLSIG